MLEGKIQTNRYIDKSVHKWYTCVCKPPAYERAVEQQAAQRPAAQHAAAPATAAAAAAPHTLAFHHHTKLLHITHQTLAQLFSASHDRHQPSQIKYYRYEISTSTRRLQPVFAQRVLSNRLATHQREKVPIVSFKRTCSRTRYRCSLRPQVGNTHCYWVPIVLTGRAHGY